jgi:hypothetical protein
MISARTKAAVAAAKERGVVERDREQAPEPFARSRMP